MNRAVDELQVGVASPSRAAVDSNDGRTVFVVVPVVERPEDLCDIYHEFAAPLRDAKWGFEFVFVLEPWAHRLRDPLEELANRGEPVRVLQASRDLGETGQLKLAAASCGAKLLLTLPAYHRVQADSVTSLLDRVGPTADLVIARRWPRRDSWFNKLQNRVFHRLVGLASKQPFRDIACGVRAMRCDLLDEIPLYGDFARFLPLLAIQEGFMVEEVDCAQHPRDRQARIYSLGTYIRRVIDLFGIFFLLRFTYKPLRFFGLFGSGLSLLGGGILTLLFVQRLMGRGLADRPLLLLGVLLFTLGFQVVALGLIGELIVHLNAPKKPSYRVLERV